MGRGDSTLRPATLRRPCPKCTSGAARESSPASRPSKSPGRFWRPSCRRSRWTSRRTCRSRQPQHRAGLARSRPTRRGAARLAAEHLLERGFRHYAYVGEPDRLWSQNREVGFRERLREAGFEPHRLSVAASQTRPPLGARAIDDGCLDGGAAQAGRRDGVQRRPRPAGARRVPRRGRCRCRWRRRSWASTTTCCCASWPTRRCRASCSTPRRAATGPRRCSTR